MGILDDDGDEDRDDGEERSSLNKALLNIISDLLCCCMEDELDILEVLGEVLVVGEVVEAGTRKALSGEEGGESVTSGELKKRCNIGLALSSFLSCCWSRKF
jgi:hypothetical protein